MLCMLLTGPVHPCPAPTRNQTSVVSNGNYTALTVSNNDTGTDARAIKVTAGTTDLGTTTVARTTDGPALSVTGNGLDGAGELSTPWGGGGGHQRGAAA